MTRKVQVAHLEIAERSRQICKQKSLQPARTVEKCRQSTEMRHGSDIVTRHFTPPVISEQTLGVYMARLTLTSVFLAVCILALAIDSVVAPIAAAGANPHGYFDALVARPDRFVSYSLRDSAQLLQPKYGGYAACNSCPLSVNYSPTTDTNPHRQDAAKLVIEAWRNVNDATVALPIGPSDTTITLSAITSTYQKPRHIKIDKEEMRVEAYFLATNTLNVTRGVGGTVATAHKPGSLVTVSANSVENPLTLPIGTTDNHVYFLTWDAYWTDSWVNTGLTNLKTFQIYGSTSGDQRWWEIQTRFAPSASVAPGFNRNTDVGAATVRGYNSLPAGNANWLFSSGTVYGPGVTDNDPDILPRIGSFIIRPNRWTRYFVRVDQRYNDYDYVDYWVADEATDPVQIYSHIPASLKPPTNSIPALRFEFNTSTIEPRDRGDRDLVTYLRNVVVLRDAANVESLLIRPSATAPLPPPATASAPMIPKNVRVIK
jgi:hypothetical protein